jgi:hypothetical protein
MEIEMLEQFRDLKIDKDKLTQLLPMALKNTIISVSLQVVEKDAPKPQ